MNMTPVDFLRHLVSSTPLLGQKMDESLGRWGNETPLHIIAYGDIGAAIADNLPTFTERVRRRLFAAIEEGMTSPDKSIRTATGTGLVEALVASADRKPQLWKDYETLCGPVTMGYATAWRDFDVARWSQYLSSGDSAHVQS